MNPLFQRLAPLPPLVAVAALAALLAGWSGGCAPVRHGARSLFILGSPTRVVATFETASAQALFLHLLAAARAAFPEAEIHPLPAEHGVRFWFRRGADEPARTGFQLGERTGPEGKTVTDLVVFPLRTAPASADLPPRFPPHRRLLAELERSSGAKALSATAVRP